MTAPEPRGGELAGQRFGSLVAQFHVGRRSGKWVCRCDCGGETIARRCDLLAGRNRSCFPCAQRRRRQSQYVDDIAVELAFYGDPVNLTVAERGATVRKLAREKLSNGEIARRLRMSRRHVIRYRNGQIKNARPLKESEAA